MLVESMAENQFPGEDAKKGAFRTYRFPDGM
jgi:hypothetical protein